MEHLKDTAGEQALAQAAVECEAEELEHLRRFVKKVIAEEVA